MLGEKSSGLPMNYVIIKQIHNKSLPSPLLDKGQFSSYSSVACYVKKNKSRNYRFISSAVLLSNTVLIKKSKDSTGASWRRGFELHDYLRCKSLFHAVNHFLLI